MVKQYCLLSFGRLHSDTLLFWSQIRHFIIDFGYCEAGVEDKIVFFFVEICVKNFVSH